MQFKKINFLPIGLALLVMGSAQASAGKSNGENVSSDSVVQGGDTYNFYFQKAPGSNKVEQGATQKVEQRSEKQDSDEPTPAEKKENIPASNQGYESKSADNHGFVDVFLGYIAMPKMSEAGVAFGGEFLPKNTVGLRGEFFAASRSSIGYGEDFFHDKVSGGAFALTVNNLLGEKKIKVTPMLGVLIENFSTSEAVLAIQGHELNSMRPYFGLSSTAYLGGNFGLNLSLSVPTLARFSTASLNMVLSI